MKALRFLVVWWVGMGVWASLVAQTTSGFVLMARNTGYEDQILLWGEPLLPFPGLGSYLKNGYGLVDAYGCESHHTVVLSPESPYRNLEIINQPVFDTQPFASAYRQGRYLTHVVYKNGVWTSFLAENTGYTAQKAVVNRRKFPTEQLEPLLAQQWRITDVTFGDNTWVVVLSKGSGWGEQKIWEVRGAQDKQLQDWIAQGWVPTDVNAGNGSWVFVLTRQTGLTDLRFLFEERFPVDWVKAQWAEGYRIVEVFNESYQAKPDKALCVFNPSLLIEPLTVERAVILENSLAAFAGTPSGALGLQRLVGLQVQKQDYEQARRILAKYRRLFDAEARKWDELDALLARPANPAVKPQLLPPTVNSKQPDYLPIPTADGQGLYFTSYGRPGGAGDEDIYYSRIENGQYQKAVPVKGLNTSRAEAVVGVSVDGNSLFLTGPYPNGLGRNDLFMVHKTAGGWSAVEPLPKPINSPHFESGLSVSADGRALFFVSDRPGGVGNFHPKDTYYHGDTWGNLDLYVSLKQPDGTWGPAINLGATVNTPFAERSPFIHPDGKTLYFSSNGHTGYGRLDVFKTTRLSETDWTQWSTPVNLGKEINTAEDDYGFIVSTDGQLGYFASASRPQGFGSNDLYAVVLPTEFRPQPVHVIHGQVLDANLRPVAANIHVEELPESKAVTTIETDPQTGKFFLALPLGKQYGYYVSKPGFYPVAEHLTMETRQQAQQAGPIDIELISLEDMVRNNHPVRLNNLFFDTDRAELKPESYPELNRLAGILKQHPEYNAHIDGHTDNTGADAHNQALSEQRARAVLDYLTARGVPAARLKAQGFGKTKPVADNATEAGRLYNRRVEVRLSK